MVVAGRPAVPVFGLPPMLVVLGLLPIVVGLVPIVAGLGRLPIVVEFGLFPMFGAGLVFVTGAWLVGAGRFTGACWGALMWGAGAGREAGGVLLFLLLSCCAVASATIPTSNIKKNEVRTNFPQSPDGIMACSWLRMMAVQAWTAF